MKISEIIVKMIDYSNGNLRDINHFLKVHSFAKIIGEGENLSQWEQETLEIAAIVHDIACPLCREKYGNANGKLQEKEGVALTEKFLVDTGFSEETIKRVVYLVAHHHTYSNVDGADYQILLEADYLVNAFELDLSKENIENFMSKVFKTKTGISLLKSAYNIN